MGLGFGGDCRGLLGFVGIGWVCYGLSCCVGFLGFGCVC